MAINLARGLVAASILLTGALAGFFYAYWCSVMLGLDALPASDAIAAMQAINAKVRNARFAPAFFGPVPLIALSALACWLAGARTAALWCLGGLAAAFGAVAITFVANVPLNEALARLGASADLGPAVAVAQWRAYADPWGLWNGLRTVASFAAVAMLAVALMSFGRPAVR